tara:strand:+ start:164 stop:1243 length:1080 start_codon:yes stop_codon:yes gene_type:complete
MNILLTANYKNGLFSNGLQQNIVFLAELLKGIGFTPIIAINHKIEECVDPPSDILIIEENELLEYCEDLSFALNASWLINLNTLKLIKEKNKNFKNIHIVYGNGLLADIERCSWQDHLAISPEMVDEVWISPHYKFSYNYYKTYYNTERVFELPYIWSSKYIDMHEKIWNKINKTCYYRPGEDKNIGILEPNLNITKHCLPSIMIAEEFYTKVSKEDFNKITVYCAAKFTDKKYFKSLMWNLDVTKENKIEFKGRIKVSKILTDMSNVIISNQLLNALNYTYLEALHFNFPLIHNSELIKESGYYYPNYDTKLGAEALNLALNYHDQNLDKYKEQAQKTIRKYSPENPIVIEKYKKLLS